MAQEPRAGEPRRTTSPGSGESIWARRSAISRPRSSSQARPRWGALRGMTLGTTAVFRVCGTPQVVQRTRRAVRGSPGDFLKVCVQLQGRATVHQDDREIVIDPGRLAIYDTGRPYALRLDGRWSCAVMAVPRGAIDIAAAHLHGAMRHIHVASQGPGLLLAQFITATVDQLDAASPAIAGKLGEAGACLLSGTLALLHRSVAALAARWCFVDAAHFSRVFRESYGFPPSQARAERRAGSGANLRLCRMPQFRLSPSSARRSSTSSTPVMGRPALPARAAAR